MLGWSGCGVCWWWGTFWLSVGGEEGSHLPDLEDGKGRVTHFVRRFVSIPMWDWYTLSGRNNIWRILESFSPSPQVHLWRSCTNLFNLNKIFPKTYHKAKEKHENCLQIIWFDLFLQKGMAKRILLYPVKVLRIRNLRVQQFNYFWWESEGRRIIFHESDITRRIFLFFFFYTFFSTLVKCR